VVEGRFYRGIAIFHKENAGLFDGVLWFLGGHSVVLMCMGWGDEKSASF
jgi:hypothetical protein